MPAAETATRIVNGDLLLALPNSEQAIEQARLAARAHLDPLALGPRVTNRLEVVLEEVIANIVRHGFEAGSQQAIVLRVASRRGAIELTFDDDGRPFNPLEAPAPRPFESLETAQVGGLGIPVVRRFAAEVAYEASPSQAPEHELAGDAFRPANRFVVRLATDA